MRTNDIHITQIRVSDIAMWTFSIFDEKLQGKDWEMNKNEWEISFLTATDWYNPFSFAIHEQLVTRFSKTISSC
jgi:hypothetical protein